MNVIFRKYKEKNEDGTEKFCTSIFLINDSVDVENEQQLYSYIQNNEHLHQTFGDNETFSLANARIYCKINNYTITKIIE